MTTDFRALCKELTNELHGYASANPYHDSDKLVARARLALAEPEPPADGEVAELVAGIREIAQLWESDAPSSRQLSRAADLLERLASPACVVLKPSPELIEAFKAAGHGRVEAMERLALQPVPEGPSDEELTLTYAHAVAAAVDNKQGPFKEEDVKAAQLAGLRSVLTRWGQAPNA